MRAAALAALGLAALGGASCAPRTDGGRVLLLLTIDTLRADRVGAFGGPRGLTPVLDRLARRGVVFADAVAPSSWTMPALGTLATGLPPAEHGMVYWHLPLADVPETLAETLAARGVESAFLGNPIPRLPGLSRGFDRWETFGGDDAACAEAAAEWLRETRGRDRFLWLHLLAPHAPYDPDPRLVREDPALDPRTVLYDAEVATADRIAERVLDALPPGATVVATADHGETLDERTELAFDHGQYLFEELVRVPLVVVAPGVRPGVEGTTVDLADVPATVADFFGADVPLGARGRPLLDPGPDGTGEPDFAFVPEDEPPIRRERRWAVRDDGLKAIFSMDAGKVRLFDLEADPGETRDLSAERPAEVEARRRALEERRRELPMPRIPWEKRFSPEELERLQALGYLGGADR